MRIFTRYRKKVKMMNWNNSDVERATEVYLISFNKEMELTHNQVIATSAAYGVMQTYVTQCSQKPQQPDPMMTFMSAIMNAAQKDASKAKKKKDWERKVKDDGGEGEKSDTNMDD